MNKVIDPPLLHPDIWWIMNFFCFCSISEFHRASRSHANYRHDDHRNRAEKQSIRRSVRPAGKSSSFLKKRSITYALTHHTHIHLLTCAFQRFDLHKSPASSPLPPLARSLELPDLTRALELMPTLAHYSLASSVDHEHSLRPGNE